MACDVTDEKSVSEAVDVTVRAFVRLDGAFNNAGEGGGQVPLHEIDTGKFDSVIATNLRGPFLCLKYQIPHLIDAGGGSIVLTSSIGGLVGGAAQLRLRRQQARPDRAGAVRRARLRAGRAFRVNAIAPGPTRSEMFDRWMPTEEARAAMAATSR